MMHGDISNQGGKVIAFRFEDFLYKKNTDFISKVKSVIFFHSPYSVDEKIKRAMMMLYLKTEYNVAIICNRHTISNPVIKQEISNFDFSSFYVIIDRETQISSKLLTGEITYYVDDVEERRSLVNSKYAISFDELKGVL